MITYKTGNLIEDIGIYTNPYVLHINNDIL